MEINSPIGTVTGGWYREKELDKVIIDTRGGSLGGSNPFSGDLEGIDYLGLEYF